MYAIHPKKQFLTGDWLIAENDDDALTPQTLRDDFAMEVFDYFFGIVDNLFNQPAPQLSNTDGDLLLFSTPYLK